MWHERGNPHYQDWLVLNAAMVVGAPGVAFPLAGANRGQDGFPVYFDPHALTNVHFAGWGKPPMPDEVFRGNSRAGNHFSMHTYAGSITTDADSVPDSGLVVDLMPGLIHAIHDVEGRLSGKPGALLVPIRPCDSGSNTMFRWARSWQLGCMGQRQSTFWCLLHARVSA